MLRFIHRENIKHFLRLLEQVTDKEERRRIMNFLAEEEAKLTLDKMPENKAAG